MITQGGDDGTRLDILRRINVGVSLGDRSLRTPRLAPTEESVGHASAAKAARWAEVEGLEVRGEDIAPGNRDVLGLSIRTQTQQPSNDLRSYETELDRQGTTLEAPDWRSLVCGPEFTWECSWALAVIQCESDGDPNAVGVEWIDGIEYRFYGLWQVWNGPLDPYLNTVEAHIQYAQWQRGERGRPWPGCP